MIDTVETDLLALLNRNSYEKGGFVLHMLRAQVGERAFFDAIRAYYMKYRHATALSDDLRAEMERASHQNLGWFFDQWLRRPGYPEVEATWSYDSAARQVNVELTQGARFGAFRFPLVVGIVDSAGVVHRTTVEMTTAEGATVRMQTASTSRPMRVVLDPDVAMLARFAVIGAMRRAIIVALGFRLRRPAQTARADSLLNAGALQRAESLYYSAAQARPRVRWRACRWENISCRGARLAWA